MRHFMVDWFVPTTFIAITVISILFSVALAILLILAKYANLLPAWL